MATTETVRIDLGNGRHADLSADPPFGFFVDVASGEGPAILAALEGVLIDWNLTDRHGEALPLNAEGIRQVSFRTVNKLAEQYTAAFNALPKQ